MNSREEQRDASILKRLQTAEQRALKYSKVVVRVGPKPDEYQLPLFPLITQSVKCLRLIESHSDRDEKGPTVIGLPDFQCDEVIFRMVEDVCYGAMDEKDISTSNVVRLFNAGEFLEIDSVKNKVWKFLKENAFISWESCLDVLATFACNDMPGSNGNYEDAHFERCEENILFERCRKALLANITEKLSDSDMWTKTTAISYTFEFLLRVAELLPLNVAKNVYQSCRAKRFGLFFNSDIWDSVVESNVHSWVERLPDLLPDLSKRSLLVSCLSNMVLLPSDEVTGIIFSKFQWDFLCALLVETAQLGARSEKDLLATGLQDEIFLLQKLVCQGLGQLYGQEQELVVILLMKFNFDTLLSIVSHCRDFSDEIAAGVASIVDSCVYQHLQSSSLTPQQALLVYKEFPNSARPSHVELYQTLTVKALSQEEVLELTELLDYDKLPAGMVDNLFEELDLPGCELRLAKKYVEIQQLKRSERRSTQELIQLRNVLGARNQKLISVTEGLFALRRSRRLVVNERNGLISEKIKFGRERDKWKERIRVIAIDRDALQESKRLAETELDHLRESKRRVEEDRDALQEGKRLMETELDHLRESKRRVEVERDAFQEGKRLVETELDHLRESKRRVEVERDALQEGKRMAEMSEMN